MSLRNIYIQKLIKKLVKSVENDDSYDTCKEKALKSFNKHFKKNNITYNYQNSPEEIADSFNRDFDKMQQNFFNFKKQMGGTKKELISCEDLNKGKSVDFQTCFDNNCTFTVVNGLGICEKKRKEQFIDKSDIDSEEEFDICPFHPLVNHN